MENKTSTPTKLCELEGIDEFNCIDCPEFDDCQMILYDSYDEMENEEEKKSDESGLSIIR
ncbi:MAG: hypothetical protein A2293_04860 [Elusimicrobia bacterium RIFOXYB2_FULL_49_7]|nr:MAG: hypothetical protein A2293_04860 [Elusimicrobia bacterium RIFOXYB2_FULL_49_7]